MMRYVLRCALALVATPLLAQTAAEKNIPPDFSVIEQHGFVLPEETKRKIIESGIFDTPYNGQVYTFKVEDVAYIDSFESAKCYVEGKNYKGKPYTSELVNIVEGVISPPFAVVKRSYRDSTCAAPMYERGRPLSRNSLSGRTLKLANIDLIDIFTGDGRKSETYLQEFSYEKFSGDPGGFKIIFAGKRDQAHGIDQSGQLSFEVLCTHAAGIYQRIKKVKDENISGACQQRDINHTTGTADVLPWNTPLMAPFLYDLGGIITGPIDGFTAGRKLTHQIEIRPEQGYQMVRIGGYINIFIERIK